MKMYLVESYHNKNMYYAAYTSDHKILPEEILKFRKEHCPINLLLGKTILGSLKLWCPGPGTCRTVL